MEKDSEPFEKVSKAEDSEMKMGKSVTNGMNKSRSDSQLDARSSADETNACTINPLQGIFLDIVTSLNKCPTTASCKVQEPKAMSGFFKLVDMITESLSKIPESNQVASTLPKKIKSSKKLKKSNKEHLKVKNIGKKLRIQKKPRLASKRSVNSEGDLSLKTNSKIIDKATNGIKKSEIDENQEPKKSVDHNSNYNNIMDDMCVSTECNKLNDNSWNGKIHDNSDKTVSSLIHSLVGGEVSNLLKQSNILVPSRNNSERSTQSLQVYEIIRLSKSKFQLSDSESQSLVATQVKKDVSANQPLTPLLTQNISQHSKESHIFSGKTYNMEESKNKVQVLSEAIHEHHEQAGCLNAEELSDIALTSRSCTNPPIPIRQSARFNPRDDLMIEKKNCASFSDSVLQEKVKKASWISQQSPSLQDDHLWSSDFISDFSDAEEMRPKSSALSSFFSAIRCAVYHSKQ